MRSDSTWISFALLLEFTAMYAPAGASVIAKDGKAVATVVLAKDAERTERTAATELATYLGQITGAEFAIKKESDVPPTGAYLFVGATAAAKNFGVDTAMLQPEQWHLLMAGGNVILAGGRPRGTLYAVYHFLEDVLGVHWWNPWEESIPRSSMLQVDVLDLRGQPTFRYRDIYMLYGNDEGRFAARNRLNRAGDARISADYGGGVDYGPPYHVHTFNRYFPPDQYFAQHPEYYSLINGKRSAEHAQLCLTNPDLRDVFVDKLKQNIRSTRNEAARTGTPAPLVFDISQNDSYGACQCDRCQAVAKAEGSESGVLIEFLNFISDAIREEFPDVFLSTLTYLYTQQPPRTVRPRDNIIIRLCDTDSDLRKPITAPENRAFHDTLLEWAQLAKNLRVWDYAVTFAAPAGLPLPTVHTYAEDYRFYAQHNVEGVFTELEFPITADLRDLKVWMMTKLLENPAQDSGWLLQTFTNGFYGPAGPMVREYLRSLQSAAQRKGISLGWFVTTEGFSFLEFEFVSDAQGLFDQAERAVTADPVLHRRVRHARLPLDRATVIGFHRLTQEWVAKGNDPSAMPLNRDQTLRRAIDTWQAQTNFRLPESQRAAENSSMDAERRKFGMLRPYLPIPKKFRGLPRGSVLDFTANLTRNSMDVVRVVKDAVAETGITNRLEFPTPVAREQHPVQKYRLPMPWGLYSTATKTLVSSANILPEDVPGPGYHWYRYGAGPTRIGPSSYLYFFWSWIIQLDLDRAFDPSRPDVSFDIWARVKFEGSAFPHGTSKQKNAICVERVILVGSDARPVAP